MGYSRKSVETAILDGRLPKLLTRGQCVRRRAQVSHIHQMHINRPARLVLLVRGEVLTAGSMGREMSLSTQYGDGLERVTCALLVWTCRRRCTVDCGTVSCAKEARQAATRREAREAKEVERVTCQCVATGLTNGLRWIRSYCVLHPLWCCGTRFGGGRSSNAKYPTWLVCAPGSSSFHHAFVPKQLPQ